MKTIEQIAQFFNESKDFKGSVKLNENLASHTTMHVGGNAKIFLEPQSSESLALSLKFLSSEKIKFFLMGGGSNVIISDKGLDVVVSTRKLNSVSEKNNILSCGAGSSWGSVITLCKKNNLKGFEALTGLSGTVGGAIFMNASCFGSSTSDNLLGCDYIDLSDFKIHRYEKKDSDWGYKKSPFQDSQKIVVRADFSVGRGFDTALSEKCMSARNEKGHFRSPSSGSAFKNDHQKNIIAGKVIEECGLKGYSVGGAQIAPWHGNFIINSEMKAKASDIKTLSEDVKKIVLEKKGILLETEILFIGDF